MSMKAPDYHAIPLCDICHASIPHTGGYGDLWPQIMEAWLPLMAYCIENILSLDEEF